ncbi:MAG: AI-2E family transporter [Phycisphaerae bacterium]|nr:AI-2E family transporter [Phycisphaerae bacterium]
MNRAGVEHYLPPLSPEGKRWARFLGVIVAAVALAWACYSLRAVLTPLIVALVIAYICNPFVTWIESWGARRLMVVVILYILLTAVLLTGGVIFGVKTFGQFIELRENLPQMVDSATRWIETTHLIDMPFFGEREPAASGPAKQTPWILSEWTPTSGPTSEVASQPRPTAGESTLAYWWKRVRPLLQQYGMSVLNALTDGVGRLVTNLTALASVLVLIPLYAFFFLWHFNELTRIVKDHLPWAYRPQILHTLTTIDRAVADFFRGRLMVCLAVGLLNGVGWQIVGLRNGLLLGLLCGLFSLVPFLSILVLPLALLTAYSSAPQSWAMPVVMAFGVFMAVQALESFVLSPAIESQANGLHPITTVVVLLIGAQLAGLLGMLLAIPLTSTLKTLANDWIMPEVRRLAREPAPASPSSAAPAASPAPADPPPAKLSSAAPPPKPGKKK